jgi:hypothetical protein
MKWLIISLIAVANLAQAESSGESVARPPTVILTEAWLYNIQVPVYQVNIANAGESAVLQAAQAAVASVRPEFKNFGADFVRGLDHYVVARQDSGSHTTIYILRTIVADWLIMS